MRKLFLVLCLIFSITDGFSATINRPRQPSSATTVEATTYTVPAGQYVRATVTYTVNANPTSVTMGGSTITVYNVTTGQKSGSVSFWLYTGQTIALSKTAANSNQNFSGGSGAVISFAASSTLAITIDTVNVDTITAQCFIYMNQVSATASITIGGVATGSITLEHYTI